MYLDEIYDDISFESSRVECKGKLNRDKLNCQRAGKALMHTLQELYLKGL